MYYTYSQNNSGGSFTGKYDKLIIQANSPSEADAIAEQHGVYFNGCKSGIDCSCCGDRWHRADWGQDEKIFVTEEYGHRIDFGFNLGEPSLILLYENGKAEEHTVAEWIEIEKPLIKMSKVLDK